MDLKDLHNTVVTAFKKPLAQRQKYLILFIEALDKIVDKKSLAQSHKETASMLIVRILDDATLFYYENDALRKKHLAFLYPDTDEEAEIRLQLLRDFLCEERNYDMDFVYDLDDEALENLFNSQPKAVKRRFEKEYAAFLEEEDDPFEANNYGNYESHPLNTTMDGLTEEMKTDIKQLFKSLSKRLHPDLEQDDDSRLKKEEQMKVLNQARKENNLFSLLKIQADLDKQDGKPSQEMDAEYLTRINAALLTCIIHKNLNKRCM